MARVPLRWKLGLWTAGTLKELLTETLEEGAAWAAAARARTVVMVKSMLTMKSRD